MLSSYSTTVIARAARADNGLPALLDFLNLAKIKKHLERWADEELQDRKRANPRGWNGKEDEEWRKRMGLIPRHVEPTEPATPEAKARVGAKAEELKRILRGSLKSMQDVEREVREMEADARVRAIEQGSKPQWDRPYKPSEALVKALRQKVELDTMVRQPYRDD